MDYEVTVIGAGPGGYEAAIKAAQLGKKVCIVENRYFGGTCLNVGCIPTKALIKTANVLDSVKTAAQYGIEGVDTGAVKVSMEKVQQRKKMIVSTLTNGVQGLLRANKVTMVKGTASFVDQNTISVGDETITSENFIIATGSSTFMPPFIPCEGETNVITSTEALDLDYVPESIAIIGGGVIGIEFAYLFAKMGSKVSVLELMDSILPMVDAEVAKMAQKKLVKEGVAFHLGARVQKVSGNKVIYELDGEEQAVEADAVLMAVGRVPNTEGLNAEGIGLEFDKRAIKTDASQRTSIPNIYAIGDVNGKVLLAHVASHEGITAAENICGANRSMEYDAIPSCIYTEPEIASVGLTEAQARESYANVKVGKFPMMANGKALVEGSMDGVAKVIIDADTKKILGAHLYCEHASDMIAELALAMSVGATAEEVIHAIHPHPSISEVIPEAFMFSVYGKAINFL